MLNNTPLVLLILDGWGFRESAPDNAIAIAHTPQWDKWWETMPHILLHASGKHVGLPDQQMGNSEVGHMHISAGRLILQGLTRINAAIESGEFAKEPIFLKLINDLKKNGKTLHIMGLLSNGGVHSHENHLFAILALCHAQKFTNICLHLFLDGRDVAPQSALESMEKLNQQLAKYPGPIIGSIAGRYFAMDRDKRWQRLEPVYHLLTEAKSDFKFDSAIAAINSFYKEKKFDEFIPPTIIGHGCPIKNGDSIIFFNFRADRARQLTAAFCQPNFNGFIRNVVPIIANFITMTPYEHNLAATPVFPSLKLSNTLGEIIANNGLRQLRIAETEKYAHVTFFFNGGREAAFANEERILIPSPKVTTYDLSPQMSAEKLTASLVQAILAKKHALIICNYANADMVGHTGNFAATVQAIECLDQCMQQIGQAISKVGGILLITADHGNAEIMYDNFTGQAHTAHTNLRVPLLVIGKDCRFNSSAASLIDLAPTIIALLGIAQPQEMTGHSLLLVKDEDTSQFVGGM